MAATESLVTIGPVVACVWRIFLLSAVMLLTSKVVTGQTTAVTSGRPCLPFDQTKATLDSGFWTFSLPHNISSPLCSHHYHVASNDSSAAAEDGCKLRRFTAEGGRKCLSGKHVVFIGDSVSRHQFESLVIWMETGEHANPISHNPTPHSAAFSKQARNANGCGHPRVRCDYDDGRKNSTVKTDNRYYFNPEFNFNLSMFSVFSTSNGHSPVGWFPPDVPFHQPNFEWQRGGMPHIAAAIKKWFGQVDVIIANVGIWALEDLVPTMWESQAHYMTGPMEKVLDELNMLTPLSREVCDVLLGLPSLVVVSRL
jgi:GDSL/SGNH-like Acyl-Esterase family found in Pmr5 and Cas1p